MSLKIILLVLMLSLTMASAFGADREDNETTERIDHVTLVDEVSLVREVERITGMTNMFVGGTEYVVGDEGKIFVQLDQNGIQVTNATCRLNMWFANSSQFIFDAIMLPLEKGIFFHDFIVPNATGVLPVSVQCDYLTVLKLSFPENLNVTVGSTVEGTIGDTYTVNGDSLIISETVGGDRGFEATFDFFNTSIDNTTSVVLADTFVRRIRQPADPDFDFINIFALNFTSGQFVFIRQGLDYSDTFQRRASIIPLGFPDFADANGTVRILINDTLRGAQDNKDTTLEVDLLRLLVFSQQENTTIQHVRGGGEVHIRQPSGADEPVRFVIPVSSFVWFVWFLLLLLGVWLRDYLFWLGLGLYTLFLGIYTVVIVGSVLPGVGVVFISLLFLIGISARSSAGE